MAVETCSSGFTLTPGAGFLCRSFNDVIKKTRRVLPGPNNTIYSKINIYVLKKRLTVWSAPHRAALCRYAVYFCAAPLPVVVFKEAFFGAIVCRIFTRRVSREEEEEKSKYLQHSGTFQTWLFYHGSAEEVVGIIRKGLLFCLGFFLSSFHWVRWTFDRSY